MHYHKLERNKYGYAAGIIGVVVNIIVFLLKFFIGIAVNSIAVIADSIHTLSDVITSIAVIIGFKVSAKPADKEHPFGHGRGEFITSLIIAVFMAAVGIELAKDSIFRMINPPEVRANIYVFIVIICTVLLKEVMARITFYLGKKIDSLALDADAWHHRSDALSSIVVAVGILATSRGYFRVDAILGLAVSLFLIYIGIKLVKDSSSVLLGKAASAELMSQIREIAKNVSGIKGVHKILVHNYGTVNSISLHIEVDKNLSLKKAHDLAEEVEARIQKEINAIATAHVDIK